MVDMNEYLSKKEFRDVERPLIDDPHPRERRYPFISVDDHFVEPPDTFIGRVEKRFASSAPRIVEVDGMEYWQIDGELVPNTGGNAHVSWAPEYRYSGPVRFDQIRRGTYDVHDRIRDMDIAGVLASLCFPSSLWGFASRMFMNFRDPHPPCHRQLTVVCTRLAVKCRWPYTGRSTCCC